MSAAVALRAAVCAALRADGSLVALLGSSAVYDEPSREARPPYVVLADHASRDASTATEPGEEHELTLQVWSRQGGLKEALAIAERVSAILSDSPLTLTGHRLVNLRWLSTDSRRDGEARHRFARLRFRALTEPL